MLRRKTLNQIHATHRDRIASRPRIAATIMLFALPCFGGFFSGTALAADAKHADASHAGHDAGHGDHGHLPEIGHNPPAGVSQKDFESPASFKSDLAIWSFVIFLGLLAKRMLASYERRLAEATDEVRGMLEEARRDADVTRQAIVAEARKAADDEKNRARHEIGLAKDDALAQIADRAGDLAVEVAGKFLREKLGREDQARLVRDSVASIGTKPSVN